MANEAAGRHQCKGSEENRSHASFRVGNTNLTSALACRADLILTNVSSSRRVSGARDCPKGGKPLVWNVTTAYPVYGNQPCEDRGYADERKLASESCRTSRAHSIYYIYIVYAERQPGRGPMDSPDPWNRREL